MQRLSGNDPRVAAGGNWFRCSLRKGSLQAWLLEELTCSPLITVKKAASE